MLRLGQKRKWSFIDLGPGLILSVHVERQTSHYSYRMTQRKFWTNFHQTSSSHTTEQSGTSWAVQARREIQSGLRRTFCFRVVLSGLLLGPFWNNLELNTFRLSLDPLYWKPIEGRPGSFLTLYSSMPLQHLAHNKGVHSLSQMREYMEKRMNGHVRVKHQWRTQNHNNQDDLCKNAVHHRQPSWGRSRSIFSPELVFILGSAQWEGSGGWEEAGAFKNEQSMAPAGGVPALNVYLCRVLTLLADLFPFFMIWGFSYFSYLTRLSYRDSRVWQVARWSSEGMGGHGDLASLRGVTLLSHSLG